MLRTLFLLLLFLSINMQGQEMQKIKLLIENGEFSEAKLLIDSLLILPEIAETNKLNLRFELERMERIKLDFRRSDADVLEYIRRFYPQADNTLLSKFEQDLSLENMIIDNKKYYFNRSAPNLFRINPEARKRKIEVEGETTDQLDIFLEKYLPGVFADVKNTSKKYTHSIDFVLDYTITLDKDVVPDGETVRCWLPYANENPERQENVKLISANADNYIISPENYDHRTIYMEKTAIKGQPTVFNIKFSYTSYGEWNSIMPEKVLPYNSSTDEYKHYTAQRLPHIEFTKRIKELGGKLKGNEKNPYLIAKNIFSWINENIPWAGAREYSTLYNIPEYSLVNGHGDCGIKTLLFITLCRYNGIPARWQSGWMLHPGETNLHDWGEFYLEGYGWLPVDQSFGLTNSDVDDVRYFFLGGMDPYRLIVNTDYTQPLYPVKVFPRSETVDFQRGELEWRGGNIYFDKWDYTMKVFSKEK